MIFAMLMLLQLCTRVLRESNLSAKRKRFAGVFMLRPHKASEVERIGQGVPLPEK